MDVPLTPLVVDVVTFDRAPLGRRGYNEDQVDDFLDRIQATLAGEDTLTAAEVRAVEFDPAPFIRRGYHEDQVDEFLDLVVEELDRREGNPPGGAAGATGSAVGGFPWSRTPLAGMPGSGTSNALTGVFGSTSPGNTPGAHHVTGGSPGTSGMPTSGTGNTQTGAFGTSGMPSNSPASGTSNTPAGTPGSNLGTPSTSGMPGNAPTSGGTSGTSGMPGNAPTSGSISSSSNTPAGTPGSTSIPDRSNTPGSNLTAGTPGTSSMSGNTPTSGTSNTPTGAPGMPSNAPAGTHGSTGPYPGSGNHPTSGSNPSAGTPGSPGGAHPDPIAWLPFPPAQPRAVPPLTPAEQTNPMLFAQPPSWPSPSTQPLKREPGAASGPPNSSVAATTDETGASQEAEPGESPIHAHSPSVEAGQAASALRAGATSDMAEEPEPDSPKRTLADYAPKQPPPDAAPTHTEPTREAPDPTAEDAEPEPTFPLPPAPPGEPGYAPSDVARLMKLLTTAPDREQLTDLTFGLVTTGGYHTGTVDALRQAWIDALPTKQP
jgi:DivIVA domain-containing protein